MQANNAVIEDDDLVSEDGFRYEIDDTDESELEEKDDKLEEVPIQDEGKLRTKLGQVLRNLGLHKTLFTFGREDLLKENFPRGSIDVKDIDDILESSNTIRIMRELKEENDEVSHRNKILLKELKATKKELSDKTLHCSQHINEKSRLKKNILRLTNLCDSYKPTFDKLKRKYEAIFREKSLMRITCDRLRKENRKLKDMCDPEVETYQNERQEELKTHDHLKTQSGTLNMPSLFKSFSRADYHFQEQADTQLSLSKLVERHKINLDEVEAIDTFQTSAEANTFLIASVEKNVYSLKDLDNKKLFETSFCQTAVDSWTAALSFHPHEVTASSFLIAAGQANGCLNIIQVDKIDEKFIQKAQIRPHSSVIWSLDWCFNGIKLLSAGNDRVVNIYDGFYFKTRTSLRGHTDSVNSAKFHPQNDCLVTTASADKTVSVWDARTSKCEVTFFGSKAAVSAATFLHNDAHLLLSCDLSGMITLWDHRKVRKLHQHQISTNEAAVSLAASNISNQACIGGEKGFVSMLHVDNDPNKIVVEKELVGLKHTILYSKVTSSGQVLVADKSQLKVFGCAEN